VCSNIFNLINKQCFSWKVSESGDDSIFPAVAPCITQWNDVISEWVNMCSKQQQQLPSVHQLRSSCWNRDEGGGRCIAAATGCWSLRNVWWLLQFLYIGLSYALLYTVTSLSVRQCGVSLPWSVWYILNKFQVLTSCHMNTSNLIQVIFTLIRVIFRCTIWYI